MRPKPCCIPRVESLLSTDSMQGFPKPWGRLQGAPPPDSLPISTRPLLTNAEVSVLIVARAALGPPPVHGPEAAPIRGLIADPRHEGESHLKGLKINPSRLE